MQRQHAGSRRRRRFSSAAIAIAWALAGTAGCARSTAIPAESPQAVAANEQAAALVAPAGKALDAHDWSGAKAILDAADAKAKTWEDRGKIAYYRATLLAYTGDLEGSLKVLLARLSEAKAHPESNAEAWLHNQLTWVYWSLGDGPHALAETGEMSAALDRAKLPVGAVDALRLHALWDRAYLLAESGSAVGALPSTDASVAKEAYEALATRLDDLSGMAVLRAYFAVRARDKAAAHAALATPELAGDEDMQDLYVLAYAYDLVGDTENAKAQRTHIEESKNAYLMHAIILRRLASDVTK